MKDIIYIKSVFWQLKRFFTNKKCKCGCSDYYIRYTHINPKTNKWKYEYRCYDCNEVLYKSNKKEN